MADKKHWTKPAGRGGSFGWSNSRTMGTAEEVWTPRQRQLFESISHVRKDIDDLDVRKEDMTDNLSIFIKQMVDTGFTRARVAKLFHLSPSTVSNLLVRAESVEALRNRR